jgi:uncharacterized membrane protein
MVKNVDKELNEALKNANSNLPSWKFRRRAVFGSLLFAAGILVYLLIRWESTSLAETMTVSAFGLIGVVVASYIGGAVWEDTSFNKHSNKNGE